MRGKNVHKYYKLASKVFQYSRKIWYPSYYNKVVKDTHSWFNIEEKVNPYRSGKIIKDLSNNCDSVIKCKMIRFVPTIKQRMLLLNWFEYSRFMYNATVKYFKGLERIRTVNWMRIRNLLLEEKHRLMNESKLSNFKQRTTINSHVMDAAIKKACTSYKSCLTNLRKGNIKHFRVRYLKSTKSTKVFHVEKKFIAKNKNTFCSTVFKEEFKCESNFQLKDINKDFSVYYNSRKNIFAFLVPYESEANPTEASVKKETVSLDPGIRTFMTGYSSRKCMDIGSNMFRTINKYIDKIDRANNCERITETKLKRVENRCYSKIDNLINDMHWKAINYLTNNFGNILIGNMSTKSIVRNNPFNRLPKKVKRVALFMKLYVFKQRLQFKCNERHIGYAEIDEAYTSKTCSACCIINERLGANKEFKCSNCGATIDRDINGARNIMLRSF